MPTKRPLSNEIGKIIFPGKPEKMDQELASYLVKNNPHTIQVITPPMLSAMDPLNVVIRYLAEFA
jgi:hypothetical protein